MSNLLEPSPDLVEGIVQKLKTNGMFDEMRRDCLADIDTKPAFQNLKQRVENFVNSLLSSEVWTPSLNKNQLRSKVRMSVMQSGMLNSGIEHILHQVVDAKMYTQFLPKISAFIEEYGDAVRKELEPQVETALSDEEMEESTEQQTPPPLPLVQEEQETNEQSDIISDDKDQGKGSNEEDLPSATAAKVQTTSEEAGSSETPVIPEGAASTLRTFLQSLIGSNIHSLLQTDKDEESGADAKHRKSSAGDSPSIDPSHIEAFTDGSDEDEAEERVGPKTPDSPKVYDEETGQMYASGSDASVESSDGASEKSHSSVNSNPENVARHSEDDTMQSDDNSVREYDGEEHQRDSEDFYAKEDLVLENSKSAEEEEEETFEETIEEVEVVGVQEDIYEEEYIVTENPAEELEQIVVDDTEIINQSEDATNESAVAAGGHSERKKRHKRHHRRRRRSSSEDSSEDSGEVVSSADSEREVESDDEDVHKSRSRKRRHKKKGKKKKKSRKTRLSEVSPEDRSTWDPFPGSSSEYHRSSLSPGAAQPSQRRSFIPSPQHRPLRFDDDRTVKVEPVFMPQMPPRYRDPYAIGHRDVDGPRPPADVERNFVGSAPHHGDMGMGFRPRFSPPHGHHFPGPRFPSRSRYSPPYGRGPPPPPMPFRPRGGNSPPRRYGSSFDPYRPPMRPGFEPNAPRSPPPGRRFSPPRQMNRFPGLPPGPFPSHPEHLPPGHGPPVRMPPGPAMRHEIPPGPPDMRRPMR